MLNLSNFFATITSTSKFCRKSCSTTSVIVLIIVNFLRETACSQEECDIIEFVTISGVIIMRFYCTSNKASCGVLPLPGAWLARQGCLLP